MGDKTALRSIAHHGSTSTEKIRFHVRFNYLIRGVQVATASGFRGPRANLERVLRLIEHDRAGQALVAEDGELERPGNGGPVNGPNGATTQTQASQ